MSIWRADQADACAYQVSVSTGTVQGGKALVFMGLWGTTAGTMAIRDGATELGVLTVSAGVVAFPFGSGGLRISTSLTISASAAVATILFR